MTNYSNGYENPAAGVESQLVVNLNKNKNDKDLIFNDSNTIR
jgi:hypothetical protein